jgi:hypothetical protein
MQMRTMLIQQLASKAGRPPSVPCSTEPPTHPTTGHFKLLVILTAGIFLFHEDANWVRLSGMGLAFAGIVSYSTLKQNMASGWEKPKLTPDGGPLPVASKAGLLAATSPTPKGAA